MYYTGTDRAAWEQDVTFGPGNTPFSDGGRLVNGPAPVTVTVSNTVEIFGRGADNALWWSDPATGQAWASLGGKITSKPSVIAEGANGTIGSMAAFARGGDRAVWYTFQSPAGWQAWSRLGGQLYPGTAPAAVYVGSTVYVLAAGTDQRVYVDSTSDGSRWSGWTLLGGKVSSSGGDPAAAPLVTLASSGAAVFVRGTNNAVWYNEFTGATTAGWHSLGGNVTSGIGAVTEYGTRCLTPCASTDLFALGTDNKVWEDSGIFPAMSGWTPDQ